MRLPKQVCVVWKDIVATCRWMDDESIEEIATEVCMSLGFVAKETKETLWLAGTFSPEGDDKWTGVIAIPKGCIVKRQTL